MLNQTTQRRPDSSLAAAALKGEATKPANCYRIDNKGMMEGVELELTHPLTRAPALFAGASYVKVDTRIGCIIAPIGKTGIVRRADIEWTERPGYNKPLALLVQPNTAELRPLLHANVQIELSPGMKFNERFYTDIVTAGERIVCSQDQKEMLIRLSMNDDAVLYFPDGSVRVVVAKGGNGIPLFLEELLLSYDEQAEYRLLRIDAQLEAAKLLEADDGIRREDWLYHELIAILNVGGRVLTSAYETIYGRLEALKKKGELRPQVERHALEALKKHRPEQALYFRDVVKTCALGKFSLATSEPDTSARKGPPASRLKKKQARSDRDREARLKMRGVSSGGKSISKKK